MSTRVIILSLVIAVMVALLPQAANATLPTNNLVLDLRAGIGITETDIIDDEHGIVTWEDQSGNDHDFHSPGTYGTMPYDAMRIDGVNGVMMPITYWPGAVYMRLEPASEIIDANFTICVLMKGIGGGSQERIIFSDYGYIDNHELFLFLVEANGSVKASIRDWYTQTIQVTGGDGISDYSVVTVKLDGKTLTLYQNGNSLGSATGDENWLDPNFSYSGGLLPCIGALSGFNYGPFAGDLLEVAVYSSALDDATRGQVEAELASRLIAPENCNEAILNGYRLSGDLNDDCRVDFEDFASVAEQWLSPVGFTDIAVLAQYWLNCMASCE